MYVHKEYTYTTGTVKMKQQLHVGGIPPHPNPIPISTPQPYSKHSTRFQYCTSSSSLLHALAVEDGTPPMDDPKEDDADEDPIASGAGNAANNNELPTITPARETSVARNRCKVGLTMLMPSKRSRSSMDGSLTHTWPSYHPVSSYSTVALRRRLPTCAHPR